MNTFIIILLILNKNYNYYLLGLKNGGYLGLKGLHGPVAGLFDCRKLALQLGLFQSAQNTADQRARLKTKRQQVLA